MSLRKSTAHRLSLLAGASLLTVGLAPSAALAQAVCSPAPSSGAGTSSVGYSAGTYNPGITCTASGAPMTVTTGGAITVSASGGDPLNPLVNGVNLVGGAQNVTWNSTAGAVTGGAQTNGPVIDVTTSTGAISITTAAVTATNAGTTHAIRATATGAGSIAITRQGGAINNNVASSENAIEAVSNGGNISYTGNLAGATTGRLRGILAQTSGAGGVTISLNAGNVSSSVTEGVAAVDVIAGTGGVNISMNSTFAINFNGGTGATFRVASASAAVLNGQAGSINGRMDFSGVTAGGATLNLAGTQWTARDTTVLSGLGDTLNIGNASTLTAGAMIDFGGGADRFNVTGTYAADVGTIAFGAGADRFDVVGRVNANGALVDFGADADTLNIGGVLASTGATLDFGAGDDVLNLTGAIAVNGLTIESLETFNHQSGAIYLGGTSGTETDGVPDDTFALSGLAFVGSGSGRVVTDILYAEAQVGCATLTGAADCLDLRGSSTSGVTLVTPNYIGLSGALAGYNPVGVTVVDVGGGTSAAGHFVLDPNSDGYVVDPLLGGAIDRLGLFRYVLAYDAANQRHAFVGLPRREVMGYAVLSGVAQSIWHMTADTVTDRQTDLRDAGPGGLWLRTSGEYTRRDVTTGIPSFGDTIPVDNGYKLYAGTIMGGVDLINGENDRFRYVAGAQLGYVSSSFDMDESDSSGRLTGATGGVYAGLWSDVFFVDGTVNLNGLALDYQAPVLNSKTTTYLNSIGASAEAGVRARVTENTFAEPLATVSWVRTNFEEISLYGGEIQPGAAESLRTGLGMRLGATLAGEAVSASYYVVGRGWYEFEGETGGVVHNPGADLPFADEFTGAFGEAELGVSIYSTANTLSGFATTGVKWKDGYNTVTLALGIRMAW